MHINLEILSWRRKHIIIGKIDMLIVQEKNNWLTMTSLMKILVMNCVIHAKDNVSSI
jgi:hypothetical protein